MTLRDLLELACESSCSDGFRSYPRRLLWHGHGVDPAVQQAKAEAAPVHLLIEADLRRSPSRTLSSILFPRSLTRSLSRRLVFWRRHRGDDDDRASDADERDSLCLPSPVVSSCSASECGAESEADAADLLVRDGNAPGASDEPEKPSPSTSSSGCAGSVDDGAADGDGHSKALGGDPVGSMMEEKQQLSPVCILDFPFRDDGDTDERSDAGTCSPTSFQQCQHDLERSDSARELLRHKIRRLDGLAQQGVDPVDLEQRFDAADESGVSVPDDAHSQSNSSTSTDRDSAATTTQPGVDIDSADLEPRLVASDQSGESEDAQARSNSSISTDDSAATASTPRSSDGNQKQGTDDAESEPNDHHRLFARLLEEGGKQAAASVAATERLLLDFFAEGLDRRRSLKAGPVLGTVKPSDDRHEPSLVRAAMEWVKGAGTQWGVEDVLFAGAAALADMDRGRRWMCVAEEEREVGAALGELLVDALVAELVSDLAVVLRC
ncbi:unnamed protein product [Alopecurus aequalis]